MALPHYNLDTSDNTQQFQSAAFPVVLVPADASRKARPVRHFLRARWWLTMVGIIAMLAVAALLWLALDPNQRTFAPQRLLWPAVTLGICGFFFLLALWAGRASQPAADTTTDTEETPESEILPPEAPPTLPPALPHIAVSCEQWVSEPFTEIMDEAVLAEIFDDEMVAPDHLVFSLRVDNQS
ncbi:MAG: hypothetical protein U0Y68_12055 [Blastocatellia bacterium]